MKVTKSRWFKCAACFIVLSVFMLVTETPVRAEQNMNSRHFQLILSEYYQAVDPDARRVLARAAEDLFISKVDKTNSLIIGEYEEPENIANLTAFAQTDGTVESDAALRADLRNFLGPNATITIKNAPSTDANGSWGVSDNDDDTDWGGIIIIIGLLIVWYGVLIKKGFIDPLWDN